MTIATPATDPRWVALIERDRAWDGKVYYAVRTTGVYCRPACPARRPNRANVGFYETPDQAEAAGFRPCKRCRPRDRALAPHTQAVAAACRMIDDAEETPCLDALARAANLSRYHFHRVFKAATGVTPRAYAAARRADRVRQGLPGAGTVTQAAFDAGFNSSGRFYAQADAMLGMAPRAYRDGGARERIAVAVGACTLGQVLVAVTAKGVCAILLGDDAGSLREDLRARFPCAEVAAGDDAFLEAVARVIRFVDAPAGGLDLPLDIRGTAFQHRVWQALRTIPAGGTMSYAAVAAAIGLPAAVRAVAGACAANPLAVAVPCHRVVRADGGLSGYRWGVARKRALLDREASGSG